MKIRIGWAAVALSGCGLVTPFPGREVQCVSRCGVQLVRSAECETFQAAEDRALLGFERIGIDPVGACSKLGAVTVELQPDAGQDGSWYSPEARGVVYGLTFCTPLAPDVLVRVGTSEWRKSALTHEFLHALECPQPRTDHAGWGPMRYYEAINWSNLGY
jgi:hypothetical protein